MPTHATKILVPVNESPVSEAAFRWSCQFAKNNKAELHAVYVNEVPLELALNTEFSAGNNQGERVLAQVEAIAHGDKCKVHAQLLQARHAGPAIALEAADRNMDLIVLGVGYRERIGPHPFGSTANYLLEHAPCQVVLWRDAIHAPVLSSR